MGRRATKVPERGNWSRKGTAVSKGGKNPPSKNPPKGGSSVKKTSDKNK